MEIEHKFIIDSFFENILKYDKLVLPNTKDKLTEINCFETVFWRIWCNLVFIDKHKKRSYIEYTEIEGLIVKSLFADYISKYIKKLLLNEMNLLWKIFQWLFKNMLTEILFSKIKENKVLNQKLCIEKSFLFNEKTLKEIPLNDFILLLITFSINQECLSDLLFVFLDLWK